MHLNKKQIKKHVAFWIIIIAYLNILAPVPGSWAAKIFGGALESFNYLFVFYSLSLFVFPKCWDKRRIYWMFVLISYCLYSTVTYLNYLKIIPYLGGSSFHQNEPISLLFIDNIFYFSILGSSATASFFYRYSILKYKLQAEKEKSLLIKELNFLKNQFNSHITFNFLNYCYSKIHRKLPDTAESIGLFSDMLRYTLQTRPEESVSLANEITNIENFINLQKLLTPKVYATFSYEGETKGKFILPRILITFVENAFKHGVCNDAQTPILINLKVNEKKMTFTVNNKVNTNKKKWSALSGLENVKQILDLYYINHYELKHEKKEEFYNIELCIEFELSTESITQKITTKTPLGGLAIKPLMRLNKPQIQKHVIAWFLIIIYVGVTSVFTGTWTAIIISNALIHLNFMFVFYGMGLFVFPKYWEGKRISLVIFISFILLLYWINGYIIFKIFMPDLGVIVDIQKVSFYNFLMDRFYFFVIASSAGIASFFIRYGLYKIKLQTEKEKSLLVKELNFLKDQFNSHLTFNFLNYCYSNIHKESPETAESISNFSNMLHYTLQTGADEKVALSKEIIYIENFISLQKLLSVKVYANFDYTGDINKALILPRILGTFVENAYKHGLCNDSKYPIQINLIVKDNKLAFTIRNKINHSTRIESTNKGMENVTQILDLYYTNNYELKNEKDGEFYCVELWIGLTVSNT